MLLACCLCINSRCGLGLMNQDPVFPVLQLHGVGRPCRVEAVDCHDRRDLISNGRMVGVRGSGVDLCWLNVHSSGFKSSGLIFFLGLSWLFGLSILQ